MPAYCTHCGSPVQGAFCVNCGRQAQASNAPAAASNAPLASAPPATAPNKSGLAKPLLIIGGILVVILVLGAAGAAYTVYWIKHKAMARISTYTGVSMGEVTVSQGQACTLLPREELGQVLGVAIEKSTEIMDGSDPGCAYFTNAAGFAQLQRMAIQQVRREGEAAQNQPTPKTDNPLELLKDVNKLEGVVKTLGLSQGAQDGRVFAFTVERGFGRQNWPTIRATLSVVPGFEDVTGVGDSAVLGSFGHTLIVLKGDSAIKLELIAVPEARKNGAAIGRKILSRL